MKKYKINLLDLIGAFAVLLALYLVTVNYIWWLLYAIGCSIYVLLHYRKKLYFGMIMNMVAIIIAVCNFIGGLK